MELRSKCRQRGISLTSLVLLLAVLGTAGVLALRVFPTVTEYMSIKKAIVNASSAGSTPAEVRASFDRQAQAGYVDSISGKDLEIIPNGSALDVSFSYQKIIPLVGPASLLLEYQGSTAERPASGGAR